MEESPRPRLVDLYLPEIRPADPCFEAAEAGDLQAVKTACLSGHPWSRLAYTVAAEGGHLEVLRWARSEGHEMDAIVCSAAARGGHLDVLRWAVSAGCPWGGSTCSEAAKGGHLGVLEWASAAGAPVDDSTCAAAARGGRLDILGWARSHGFPWGEWTCAGAAGHGRLEVLQWARLNGAPWDCMTCLEAASGGFIDVLEWAVAHGCPWGELPRSRLRAVERPGAPRRDPHRSVLEWLQARGCPGPWRQLLNEDALRNFSYLTVPFAPLDSPPTVRGEGSPGPECLSLELPAATSPPGSEALALIEYFRRNAGARLTVAVHHAEVQFSHRGPPPIWADPRSCEAMSRIVKRRLRGRLELTDHCLFDGFGRSSLIAMSDLEPGRIKMALSVSGMGAPYPVFSQAVVRVPDGGDLEAAITRFRAGFAAGCPEACPPHWTGSG